MMSIFTDSLFMFVYIFTLLFFGIPDMHNNNYVKHKLILYINILWFYYVIQLIKKIKNKCPIDPISILKNCLVYATYAVFGYALYIDLMYMDWSKDYFSHIADNDNIKKCSIIALIVISFTTVSQLVELMFTAPQIICSN
jgi:hypothetical protein